MCFSDHNRIRRVHVLALLASVMLLVACGPDALPGSEDLTGAARPEVTATPVSEATPTPVSTPSATPTPTPDIYNLDATSDGGCNACAEWDVNGELIRTATIEEGALIYANNFERDRGNRLAPNNSCNEAEVFTTDRIAHSGLYSYKISRRKQEYHGLSGLGFRLDERNGLSYKDLIGETLLIRCRVYYEDEGFGVAPELRFALYDGYHTEMTHVHTYNPKNGEIMLDKKGNPVFEEAEQYILADTYPVPEGRWTDVRFYVKVTETEAADGFLLLCTLDEQRNAVGLFCSYYIDDLTITVVSGPVNERRYIPKLPDRTKNRYEFN